MSTTADNTLIEFRNTTALHADLSRWLWNAQYPSGPMPITPEQIIAELGKRNWHEAEAIRFLLDILRRHSVPVHDIALHEACRLRP